MNISVVILAGGRGSRFGGVDKGLMLWQGKPLIEHIVASLPASAPVFISANRNIARYQHYGYPVLTDTLDGYQGPLAGMLSALQQCKTEYLLCLPCDTPQPPSQLAERLLQTMLAANTAIAICHDGNRLQPLFALMSPVILPQLERWLASGQRKVEDLFTELDAAICDFSDQPQSFYNINTPDDVK